MDRGLGLLAAGGVICLMSLVVNGRRAADGSRRRSDRHELFSVPVGDFGKWTAVAGLVVIPLALTGFVPAAVVWASFLGWAAAVTAGLVALSRWRVARRKARRAVAPAAKAPPQVVKGMVVGEDANSSRRPR